MDTKGGEVVVLAANSPIHGPNKSRQRSQGVGVVWTQTNRFPVPSGAGTVTKELCFWP